MAHLHLLILVVLFLQNIEGNDFDKDGMHPRFAASVPLKEKEVRAANEEEKSHQFWTTNAASTLKRLVTTKHIESPAKNVILFLGDGLSIPTLAATRVFLGDENFELSFEKFPQTALSKTYCVDYQVADSACTATAYLSGIKNNYGTIGVSANVPRGDCAAMTDSNNFARSIAYYSQLAGKSAGLVTTTRVTHASPAGVFAHTSERDWEYDRQIEEDGKNSTQCDDIAKQLITGEVGRNLKVILGGGRSYFLPIESTSDIGLRTDDVDLVATWQQIRRNQNETGQFVQNRDQLLSVTNGTNFLLGLFSEGHMPYNLERDTALTPSLEEMTQAAINILSKNDEGYFLFVEGGRIDQAHHDNRAHKALDETAEFHKAVEIAAQLTSEEDTLIVVTSDHSHTLSFNGYGLRGNDVLGLVSGEIARDGQPYTALSYANGPGAASNAPRPEISDEELEDVNYRYQAVVPLGSETHGGDDVMIFARGPYAHLFKGVLEQHLIPHIMSYASCVGVGATACDDNPRTSGSDIVAHSFSISALCVTIFIIKKFI